MNQILFNNKFNTKKKKIYIVQLTLSVSFAFALLLFMKFNYNNNEKMEEISKNIDKKIKLYDIYNISHLDNENELYFGKIQINKINLEYSVFNECNEELLKISPCKFFGEELGEKGNICIAAHNYNNSKFFGRIDELEIKDTIKLIDLKNKEYKYIIYDIFEIEEDDFSILKSNKNYELTLLTCNNSNNKRIIIKAYMKEY